MEEEDVDEETAEFIPIDSIDVTGDEDEDVIGDEEQLLSSPFTSPKRESGSQKQEKKTSITPVLSKLRLLSYTVEFPAKDYPETDLFLIRFPYVLQRRKLQRRSNNRQMMRWVERNTKPDNNTIKSHGRVCCTISIIPLW